MRALHYAPAQPRFLPAPLHRLPTQLRSLPPPLHGLPPRLQSLPAPLHGLPMLLQSLPAPLHCLPMQLRFQPIPLHCLPTQLRSLPTPLHSQSRVPQMQCSTMSLTSMNLGQRTREVPPLDRIARHRLRTAGQLILASSVTLLRSGFSAAVSESPRRCASEIAS